MRRKRCLLGGLLCAAALAAMLVVPASAHGCHGGRGRGHHGGGYAQSIQASVAVCPYEDCATSGHHFHSGVTYCGYVHEGGYCDGSCATAVSHGCHRGGC